MIQRRYQPDRKGSITRVQAIAMVATASKERRRRCEAAWILAASKYVVAISRRGRIIAATEMKPHFDGSMEAEKH
jgi:hypothetical protein